jgi:hypothetical protein
VTATAPAGADQESVLDISFLSSTILASALVESQNFDRLVARYESIRRSPHSEPAVAVSPQPPRALASAYSTSERAVELALNGPPLPRYDCTT